MIGWGNEPAYNAYNRRRERLRIRGEGERPIIVLSLYYSYNIERKRYLWRERKIPIIRIIGEESKTRPRIRGGGERCNKAVIGREKDTYYRRGE